MFLTLALRVQNRCRRLQGRFQVCSSSYVRHHSLYANEKEQVPACSSQCPLTMSARVELSKYSDIDADAMDVSSKDRISILGTQTNKQHIADVIQL